MFTAIPNSSLQALHALPSFHGGGSCRNGLRGSRRVEYTELGCGCVEEDSVKEGEEVEESYAIIIRRLYEIKR